MKTQPARHVRQKDNTDGSSISGPGFHAEPLHPPATCRAAIPRSPAAARTTRRSASPHLPLPDFCLRGTLQGRQLPRENPGDHRAGFFLFFFFFYFYRPQFGDRFGVQFQAVPGRGGGGLEDSRLTRHRRTPQELPTSPHPTTTPYGCRSGVIPALDDARPTPRCHPRLQVPALAPAAPGRGLPPPARGRPHPSWPPLPRPAPPPE